MHAPAARHGDDFQIGILSPDFKDRLNTLFIGHDDIHQNRVKMSTGRGQALQRAITVAGFGDRITFPRQNMLQRQAQLPIIVNDEYAFVHLLILHQKE